MITTTLIWSSDISDAPRGEIVHRRKAAVINGKLTDRIEEEFIHAPIMVLTKCGKVMRTHWIPETISASGRVTSGGRWSGLGSTETPVMWTLWPDAAELKDALAMEERP